MSNNTRVAIWVNKVLTAGSDPGGWVLCSGGWTVGCNAVSDLSAICAEVDGYADSSYELHGAVIGACN